MPVHVAWPSRPCESTAEIRRFRIRAGLPHRHFLARNSSHRNTGPPNNPVNTPTGSRLPSSPFPAQDTGTAASAAISRIAPIAVDTGNSRR